MKGFKNKELETFEKMVSSTQPELLLSMASFLRTKYDKVCTTKDYIYAVGDIPIALVAHLDTVFKTPVKNLYYDTRKNILWSPEGLGADDRAGVYAIYHILSTTALRPHIIFTTDEEIGGLGVAVLAQQPCPFDELKYIIQLDRQGTNDCVFYDLENYWFTEYVETFGFLESWGTFSDISILCPAWKVCGVNLSVGYKNEHSVSETLNASALFDTINKVIKMLSVKDIPTFEYIKRKGRSFMDNWFSAYPMDEEADYLVHCKNCGNLFREYDTFPVKGLNGRTCFYCVDCIPNKVEWCMTCGEPFEIDPANPYSEFCSDCIGGNVKCHSTLKTSEKNLMKSLDTPRASVIQKQKDYSKTSSKQKKNS